MLKQLVASPMAQPATFAISRCIEFIATTEGAAQRWLTYVFIDDNRCRDDQDPSLSWSARRLSQALDLFLPADFCSAKLTPMVGIGHLA